MVSLRGSCYVKLFNSRRTTTTQSQRGGTCSDMQKHVCKLFFVFQVPNTSILPSSASPHPFPHGNLLFFEYKWYYASLVLPLFSPQTTLLNRKARRQPGVATRGNLGRCWRQRTCASKFLLNPYQFAASFQSHAWSIQRHFFIKLLKCYVGPFLTGEDHKVNFFALPLLLTLLVLAI